MNSRSERIDRNFLQEAKIAEHSPGSKYHGRQRIIRQSHWQAGLFSNSLIQVAQHGTAASDHDSLIDDVSGQFRRRSLEGDSYSIDDRANTLRECFTNFFVGNHQSLRNTLNQISPLDLHRERFIQWI